MFMTTNEIINTRCAPVPVGCYPHARQVGPFLYLSGIGPRKPGQLDIPGVTLNAQNEITHYCIQTQCLSVFENVKLILQEAKAPWSSLIDITVFLTNIKDDFKAFNAIYKQYFEDIQPCRTTVEVNRLPTPIAIELKCIAYTGT